MPRHLAVHWFGTAVFCRRYQSTARSQSGTLITLLCLPQLQGILPGFALGRNKHNFHEDVRVFRIFGTVEKLAIAGSTMETSTQTTAISTTGKAAGMCPEAIVRSKIWTMATVLTAFSSVISSASQTWTPPTPLCRYGSLNFHGQLCDAAPVLLRLLQQERSSSACT